MYRGHAVVSWSGGRSLRRPRCAPHGMCQRSATEFNNNHNDDDNNDYDTTATTTTTTTNDDDDDDNDNNSNTTKTRALLLPASGLAVCASPDLRSRPIIN